MRHYVHIGKHRKTKGVRHLHGPTVRQTFNTIEENNLTDTDRMLVINPFSCLVGRLGSCIVQWSHRVPLPVFDVDQVLALIQDQGITYFPGPPTIFHSLPNIRDYPNTTWINFASHSQDQQMFPDLIQKCWTNSHSTELSKLME